MTTANSSRPVPGELREKRQCPAFGMYADTVPIPSLFDLALVAGEHFAEDGMEFDTDTPSSLEVVLEAYTHLDMLQSMDDVHAAATEALTLWLQQRAAVTEVWTEVIEEFAYGAVRYLAYQYPEAAEIERDRRMLSHLFWANLVEARWAPREA